ncbi:MAG TPA: hypothetical protein VE684_19890, partial [Crenalkalicoccus sp.]|nr:hypothetical protein [Crenalkalicoccus sp.]
MSPGPHAFAQEVLAQPDWRVVLRALALLEDAAVGRPAAELHAAAALREAGRHDEADALLGMACRHHPASVPVAVEYAWIAHRLGRREEAILRWEEVCARFPEDPAGYYGLAVALRAAGRLMRLEEHLRAALARFPDHPFCLAEWAALAEAQGDRPEAERRWRELLARVPDSPLGPLGLLRLLRASERLLEAGAVREAAAQRFPQEPEFGAPQAMPMRMAPAASLPPDAMELALGFESLGENCEFAFVQQRLGTDPLGLLRWVGISLGALLAGLRTGFAGLGDRATTNINAYEREYGVVDRRYGLLFHTFIRADSQPAEQVLARQLQRLHFLRRKLLAELEAAEKIFVFKVAEPLPEGRVAELHTALRRYAPNTLLYVRPAAP